MIEILGRQLMTTMRALEMYPPGENVTLLGDADDDYLHAKQFVERLEKDSHPIKIGTLSKSEWDASCKNTIYCYRSYNKLSLFLLLFRVIVKLQEKS